MRTAEVAQHMPAGGVITETCLPPREGADRPAGPQWRLFAGSPACGREVREWIIPVVGQDRGISTADVALVVSELFTNSVVHGPAGGRVLVGCWPWPTGARIVVCDAGGATAPQLRAPAGWDIGGRGLQIVDAMAAAWGSFRIGSAQTVWCDLGAVPGTGANSWAWLPAAVADGALVPLAASATQRALIIRTRRASGR